MTEACIVGWVHFAVRLLEDPDIESLISRVAGAAIQGMGVAATGHRRHLRQPVQQRLLRPGFSVLAGAVARARPALLPITRFENACALRLRRGRGMAHATPSAPAEPLRLAAGKMTATLALRSATSC